MNDSPAFSDQVSADEDGFGDGSMSLYDEGEPGLDGVSSLGIDAYTLGSGTIEDEAFPASKERATEPEWVDDSTRTKKAAVGRTPSRRRKYVIAGLAVLAIAIATMIIVAAVTKFNFGGEPDGTSSAIGVGDFDGREVDGGEVDSGEVDSGGVDSGEVADGAEASPSQPPQLPQPMGRPSAMPVSLAPTFAPAAATEATVTSRPTVFLSDGDSATSEGSTADPTRMPTVNKTAGPTTIKPTPERTDGPTAGRTPSPDDISPTTATETTTTTSTTTSTTTPTETTTTLTTTPTMTPTTTPTTTMPLTTTATTAMPTEPKVEEPPPIIATFIPGDLNTVFRGRFHMSRGLDALIVSQSGEKVELMVDGKEKESSTDFHYNNAEGAVFPLPNTPTMGRVRKSDILSTDWNENGWVYVSNSKRKNNNGEVGALRFDRDGNSIGFETIVDGLNLPSGGGKTPWGTWIACEELSNERGDIWEVDPTGERNAKKTVLGGDGGTFVSFAYDDRNEGEFRSGRRGWDSNG